ncbi:MAG: PAS domain S-box protein [Sphingomicrobium sp.]|nr:PAS domain S-box protein [Sphingomonadales bacterium]
MTEGNVDISSIGSGGHGVKPGRGDPAEKLVRPMLFDPESLLAIADSLPVMIGYIDRNQRYTFLNRPLAEWFELPRSAILGKSVTELVKAENLAARREQLTKALAGEGQRFIAPYQHPSRGMLTTQVEYVPHAARDGSVLGVVLIAQDITEQRAAEAALIESEARFRRISDFAPVLMWVTRADGTRDFVNRCYADFAGLEIEQARTHQWREFIHPDDFERVVAESVAGEASLRQFTIESRYRRHDGEWRWLRSVSAPRFGTDGELLGFIGAASDVTVAKEAELELRREVEQRTGALAASEARFRAIFNSVLEVMVLLDPDGTVVEVNRTTTPWRDTDPQQAIGKPLWEAPTLAAYPGHEQRLRNAVAAAGRGETFAEEVRLDGNPTRGLPSAVLDVTMQPVRDAAGTISHLLFEARDVTELKQAQEQLRQSQKMEALGQLTGGIAHDFNNLLTVVVGGLDLITKKIEDEKLLRYASNALAAAERGVRLTGQLLTFSRSQRLEVRPCQVAQLVEEMRPLLRNVLGPGITKTFDLDREQIPVMADPTQLEVAVLNLAINARDAMPDGGVLSFAARKLTIEEDPELEPGEYVELAIGDTGSGMAPEVAARAFEPFFTTKDVGKGTGLGLSMVYGMARQSGGTARIDSEPGKGTTVKLYFRRADRVGDPAAAPASARERGRARAKPASVVVIDDDPNVRGFVVSSLEEMGYRVEEAADGPSGIALVAATQPDVVVIDYVMPDMSGAEAAAQILASRPDQPILFVSGYSETDDIRRAAPRASLLAKPFRPDALDAAVRAVIAGQPVAASRGDGAA